MLLSEAGGGYMYSNDGKAFNPNPALRRAGWDRDDNGNLLPAAQIQKIYDILIKSDNLPHDRVGNNGGSTGMYQQLSQDYVGARFPGATWGWGSMADTMNIEKSTRMFLERLRFTDNNIYRYVENGQTKNLITPHPAVADVLRVQQPLIKEATSSNYGADAWARADKMVKNWHDRWFTNGEK